MGITDDITGCYLRLKAMSGESEGEIIRTQFELEKKLLATDDTDVLELHYSLLADRSDLTTYQVIRAAFGKRRQAESFLLSKLSDETRKYLIADIIHILGGQRSKKASVIAKAFLNDSADELREVCLYVTGWVGSEHDIALLSKHLREEVSTKLRITAGSALRQIAWRQPATKSAVLIELKNAFLHETDINVRARIIELLGSIATKNLGIRESKDDPNVLLGNYEKAVQKTLKYLDSI